MKLKHTVAAITLAIAAVPMMASAQDWRGQRDRDNQDGNSQGQQRDWRGERGERGDRRHEEGRRDRGDYARGRGVGYGNSYYAQRGPVYQQRPVIVQRPVVVQRPRVVYTQGYGYPSYGAYGPGHGYSQRPWQVGGYYYGNGYAPTYLVNDYNNYGLYAPPRGYSWRRDDFGNYLLVAIATGIISQLILGH